jgi:hypothetical protein
VSRRAKSKDPKQLGQITSDDLCKLTGYSDIHHRQLAKRGYFPPPVNGLYNAVKSIQGVIKYLKDQCDKSTQPLADARQGKAKAQQELLEIQLAKAKKELLDAVQVKREWQNVVLTIRQKLLSLPNRLAPRLSRAGTIQALSTEIETEVLAILLELSRNADEPAP